jgi:hypothetical protein
VAHLDSILHVSPELAQSVAGQFDDADITDDDGDADDDDENVLL